MNGDIEGMVSKRLDNFEAKLDKVVETLQTLAKIEERTASHQDEFKSVWSAISQLDENHDKRIVELEKQQAGSKAKMSGNERILWLIVTVAVGAAGKLLW